MSGLKNQKRLKHDAHCVKHRIDRLLLHLSFYIPPTLTVFSEDFSVNLNGKNDDSKGTHRGMMLALDSSSSEDNISITSRSVRGELGGTSMDRSERMDILDDGRLSAA